jgi:MoaA/NifB/PqqE/SkfB family radical SAM enzyme
MLHFDEDQPVRLVELDGALLAFDRRDGRRWLVRSEATRPLRASAPPLVLFSITNACNLACSFCYRDQSVPSAWTVESAYDLLAPLAARGTLEVAFGGGEPFAFKGFCSLVERLTDSTPLVLHATTNGQLVTRELARRLHGRISELRLSVYDDAPWRDRFALLRDEGHSVGLHWLVTPERLPTLRAFVESLCALGVRKLFLLSYNGPDRALHLSREQSRTLVEIVESLAEWPIEIGLSACWGDRLDPLPKLSPERGGDCGAGDHFVSIGPSGTLSPCSFHHQRRAVRTADDVIEAWGAMRSAGPARTSGCHRTQIQVKRERPAGLWRWRAWSGNNSVDCFTVGRFASARAADDAVAELRALIAKPQRTLLDDAWEVVERSRQELLTTVKDRREFAQQWLAQQELYDAWLSEVRSWEQAPSAVERYAQAMGAVERPGMLPAAIETPDLLVSFGTAAAYLQGTTLQPFNALDWLWVYRGARVYDFARRSSSAMVLVWAARCDSDDEARLHATRLGAVARESSVWGVQVMQEWMQGPRGTALTSRVELLRLELEDRGLRFDGVAIADLQFTIDELERAVMLLRTTAPAVPDRLQFDAYGPMADEIEEAVRALDADPSTLSEWSGQKLEGSRRWPSDLAMHRWDTQFLLEAEHLPPSLGRGLLLRRSSTPYSIEAREARVTVAIYDQDPARAQSMLRSLGLDATGSTVTTEPAAVITRAAIVAARRNIQWNFGVAPADPRTAALEALQSRLNIRFRAR